MNPGAFIGRIFMAKNKDCKIEDLSEKEALKKKKDKRKKRKLALAVKRVVIKMDYRIGVFANA